MPHIKIRTGAGVEGIIQLIVDGVDISRQTRIDGFEVGLPHAPDDETYVQLRLRADTLDMDLPDRVVRAVRESQEGSD